MSIFPEQWNKLARQASALLRAGEAALARKSPEQLRVAEGVAKHVIRLLKPAEHVSDFRRMSAAAWTLRGNALRDLGSAEPRAEAKRCYAEAIRRLAPLAEAQDAGAFNELANAWTNQGIALLSENTRESLAEAIGCFDRAIHLRGCLRVEDDPWLCYGLMAGWMNRGDALTRLGSAANLEEAVKSYDTALALGRTLPLDQHRLFPARLAVAWMNRGITLQAQASGPSLALAVQSFDAAIRLLERDSEQRFTLACAWLNRGNVLLRPSTAFNAEESRHSAREALSLLGGAEETDAASAEAGFKARHILCQAIARLLEESQRPEAARGELLAEAADAADEGMRLARIWEQRGDLQFRPLAFDLFRFGARVYQAHQPHFLIEFLLENLDEQQSPGALAASREMHASALEAILRTTAELHRDGFRKVNTPEFERWAASLGELRVASERLRDIRRRHLSRPAEENSSGSQAPD